MILLGTVRFFSKSTVFAVMLLGCNVSCVIDSIFVATLPYRDIIIATIMNVLRFNHKIQLSSLFTSVHTLTLLH